MYVQTGQEQTCSRRCVVSKLPSACRTICDGTVVDPVANKVLAGEFMVDTTIPTFFGTI